MKIDILHTKPDQMNGVYRYSSSLINGLKSEGMNVREIIPRNFSFSIHGKNIGDWISKKIFLDLRYPVGDIVHSTNHWLVTKHTNIVTIHDIFAELYPQFSTDEYRRLHMKVLERCKNVDRIVVDSEYVKGTLLPYISENKIKVIHFGVEVQEPTGDNPYPDDGKLHLLTVGNFGSRKRFDRVYSYLERMENIDLYHIGAVTVEERYKECLRIQPGNVCYLGYKDDNTMRLYMKYADRFVMDSYAEGYGLPPLEAMKFGVQPIVSDIPIFHEMMGNMAYYFTDEESFIDSVMSPENSKTKLKEFVSQYDDWIKKYISLYEEVIE